MNTEVRIWIEVIVFAKNKPPWQNERTKLSLLNQLPEEDLYSSIFTKEKRTHGCKGNNLGKTSSFDFVEFQKDWSKSNQQQSSQTTYGFTLGSVQGDSERIFTEPRFK